MGCPWEFQGSSMGVPGELRGPGRPQPAPADHGQPWPALAGRPGPLQRRECRNHGRSVRSLVLGCGSPYSPLCLVVADANMFCIFLVAKSFL